MTRCQEIFTDIYERKVWGDGSGGGSSPEASAPYVEAVNGVIAEMKPGLILDIGCGDGWVASRINLRGTEYIGLEVVASVVEKARAIHKFGKFYCLDSVSEKLHTMGHELVLLKEVTQHLCDDDVLELLNDLKVFPAVIHCSALHPGDDPATMKTGGYRPVELKNFGIATQELARWNYGETSYQVELWRPQQ